MTIGTPLHRAHLSNRYDTLIIGSGMGGLSTACMLAKAGQKVLVLERHYTAGGFTHTFQRKGYEWDVGVHYIGDVHRPKSSMRRMFDYITDGELTWAEMPEVYDQIHLGSETFDYVKGEEAFFQQMLRYFPEEKVALRAYLKLIREVTQKAGGYFVLQTFPAWLAKILAPVLSRPFFLYAKRSTAEVLASLSPNKKLQAVLAGQWGDYGLPPRESSFAMHAMVARHYLKGASYPVGGSQNIAASITKVLAQHGGTVVTNAEVKEILCRDHRAIGVQLSNGTHIFADRVISAAGARNTFLKLLPAQHPARSYYAQKLTTLPASMAHICLYIGLKGDLQELAIPSSNLWIYQDEDHEKVLQSLDEPYRGEFPLVYISFPSRKDPSWADRFPGRSTIEIVVPSPFHWFENWEQKAWQKRGSDYEALKADMTEKLLQILLSKFPQLAGKIHYTELSTPLSTQHFSGYQRGEIYGLVHTPTRFTQTWLRSDTQVPQLFLTGQDIVSCGVGGALTAGALTALRILGPRKGRAILGLF